MNLTVGVSPLAGAAGDGLVRAITGKKPLCPPPADVASGTSDAIRSMRDLRKVSCLIFAAIAVPSHKLTTGPAWPVPPDMLLAGYQQQTL